MKTIGEIIHHKKFPIIILGSEGFIVYYEESFGFWWKAEYDNGNQIYIENSDGYIKDRR